MNKLYAIGDIHGCYDELMKLWNKILEDAGDENFKVIFLGDYIDRGPKSFEVVEFLIDLKNKKDDNEYVFLMGNHEDMLLHDYQNFVRNGGLETLSSYETNGHNIDVHNDFYKNLDLYHQHGQYVFVHAGIDPNFTLKDQNSHNLIWDRRFAAYDGEYEGGYFVIHGHTPVIKIKKYSNKLNIDTACVFGVIDENVRNKGYGILTAVCLPENSKDEFKYLQVKCGE